jgi:hypothetical protein
MGRRTQRARLPLLAFAAVIALAATAKLIPKLLHDTTPTSATPVRRELAGDTPIKLVTGGRACLGDVSIDRDSTLAQLYVGHVEAPGATLRLTVASASHRAAGTVRLAPRAAVAYRHEVRVSLAAPPHSTVVTVCVENRGPAVVELLGNANPRALTRVRPTLDGVPQPTAFALRLLDAKRRSLLARAPQLADRAAALSPFGAWLFWVLVPLLAVGLPLLVGAALALALRVPDPAHGEDA